jgi:hypothetical protein
MSVLMAMRDTATVRCPDCGGTREVSVRQRRRLVNEGGDMKCSVCRSITGPIKVTQAHRNYWISRYSSEWIRDTAEMIWGDSD